MVPTLINPHFLTRLSILLLFPLVTISKKVVSKDSYIWGPGLRSKVNIPSRYFYLQAVNAKDGKK